MRDLRVLYGFDAHSIEKPLFNPASPHESTPCPMPNWISTAPANDARCERSEQSPVGHYARRISRRESTRSIRGRMPNSLEMARASSSRDMALARSPSPLRWSSMSP